MEADTENAVVKPALSQAVGYVVVVVIGLIIAFSKLIPNVMRSIADTVAVMIFVTRLLKRTVGEDNEKTEMYAISGSSHEPLLT